MRVAACVPACDTLLQVMIAKRILTGASKPLPWRCLALAVAVSFHVAGQSSGAPADVDSIRHLIAEYAKAVDTADVELVKQIWSSSPEVSFIHPLGHEHGVGQVAENVFRHLMGDTFSERKLSVKDVSIHAYGDTAWSEFYWDFAAKFRKDGSALATHGRETQIYHKEQGRWRLVHVHYSGMPAAGAGQGF
ncbi:MAG: nuclear transport factor 2 family protein [Bryobacteraceae bacterium]